MPAQCWAVLELGIHRLLAQRLGLVGNGGAGVRPYDGDVLDRSAGEADWMVHELRGASGRSGQVHRDAI